MPRGVFPGLTPWAVLLDPFKDGTRIAIGKEFESPFAEGRSMAISKAIPLENITPGKYRVTVHISDLLTQRACTLEGGVDIL